MHRGTQSALGLVAELAMAMGSMDERRAEDAVEHAKDLARDRAQERKVEDHIPPKRRDPLTAIPFTNVRLDDVTVAKAIGMLRTTRDATVEVVARIPDVPVEALELGLAEYKPRWKNSLLERSC